MSSKTSERRLFAFRLVHFEDTINEMSDNLSISGRALELTEPIILLFNKFKSTEEDNKIFNDEILPSLSECLRDRASRRSDRLEGRLYPVIKAMIDQYGENLENDKIYSGAQSQLEGKEIADKQYAFFVEDLGVVTRNKILQILREKFSAKPIRVVDPSDGSRKPGYRVSGEALERIIASYEEPWKIKILEEPSARVSRVFGHSETKGTDQNTDKEPDETHEGQNHAQARPNRLQEDDVNSNTFLSSENAEKMQQTLAELSYRRIFRRYSSKTHVRRARE